MLARLRSLVRAVMRRRTFEADLDRELQSHLEQYTQDLVQSGLSLEEARRRARLDFGWMNTVKDQCRQATGLGLLDALSREARFAARQLWRSPGFTATVVLTLALAIGANTAIFSLVNALLLNGLPYARPERLGTLYARTAGPEASGRPRTIDGEQWDLLRTTVPSLRPAVSALGVSGANLESASVVRYVRTARVSAGYLDVLAVRPALGRDFSEDEDRPRGPKAAILSDATWRALGGDAALVGRSVLLKGEPYTVVGVLPEGGTTPLDADVYTPLQPGREGEGASANFVATARLNDGATWQQADAELNRAFHKSARFQRAEPGAQPTYYTVSLEKASTEAFRPQVLALMLAAGFILAIACANIAGLSLVRGMRHAGDATIRLALGASRWQIQRQLWLEHGLLAILGGAAGVGVGALALRGLLQLLPARFLPVAEVSLDWRVLGFTLGISLLTCVLSGVLPALARGHVDLRSPAPATRVVGGGIRLRQWLIAGEVALTVLLLAATGLLIRTLVGLHSMPPGFNPAGIVGAKASLDDVRFHDPAAFRKLLAESVGAMSRIPGVQRAAVGLTLPYERALINAVRIGSGKRAGQSATTNQIYVTPGYFEVLQIPVLQGRAFAASDGPDAQRVVIVNRTFARKFLTGGNPVGQYLDDKLIVGVVGDTLLSSEAQLNPGTVPLTEEETVYVPAAQLVDSRMLALVHGYFQPSWIVRTDTPAGVAAQMQRALDTADPRLTASGFFAMDDLMATRLARERTAAALLMAMSLLALLLSAVGIFTLVANVVVQRTREVGVLMALGATIPEIMLRVGRAGLSASALGVILGLAACAAVLPAMRTVLYGVGVYDPLTMLAVVLTIGAVTVLATTPILRIATIDPVRALRAE